jgi:predicted Rdx family selenoprotein
VADLLKTELGVETELVAGDRGEFTVWVGDEVVARKNQSGFPEDDKVLEAVKETMKDER